MRNERQLAVKDVSPEKIQGRILAIRGEQVMLDRDLAELYGVPVKRLNEQVSRGIRKAPKVFTEQGVAMLSAVLNSPTAILVSIAIMEAFVRMRHFMMANAEVVCRMNVLEKKQIATDAKVEEILERLDSSERPVQGVFYDGQLWDARMFVDRLVKSARSSLLLIDNWATVETLDMLAAKRKGVSVIVVTSEHRDRKDNPRPKILPSDTAKFMEKVYSKFNGEFSCVVKNSNS